VKELIINGVDVINCDYILNNSVKGKYHSPAKSMPYAKETSCIECKTNSTRYNFCKHNPDCYYKQWQRTQKQLDIAGKVIVEMTEKKDSLKENLKIKENEARRYLEEANKYRKILEKIKNTLIADQCDNCEEMVEPPCDTCDTKFLINIISEVLNNEMGSR